MQLERASYIPENWLHDQSVAMNPPIHSMSEVQGNPDSLYMATNTNAAVHSVAPCSAMVVPHRTGKRTRRGGFGRRRRRGRKVRGAAMEAALAMEAAYPWWYANMIKCERPPLGVEPSSEEVYPGSPLSTQWEYLLPTASIPHCDSIYVPLDPVEACRTRDDDEDDILAEAHIPSYLLDDDDKFTAAASWGDEDDITSDCMLEDLTSQSSETGSVASWTSGATSFIGHGYARQSDLAVGCVIHDNDDAAAAVTPAVNLWSSAWDCWRMPFDSSNRFPDLEAVLRGTIAETRQKDGVSVSSD